MVYFDDILIYNIDIDLHVEHLSVLMNVLRKEKLFANIEKVPFALNVIYFWDLL